MAGSVDVSQFKNVAIVLGAIAVVVPVGMRLGLNPVLAFLGAGLVLGPGVAGRLAEAIPWLAPFAMGEEGQIGVLADAGIVFLMFMIGIELSFERLWTLRRLVFGLGLFQVAASGLALMGVLLWLGSRQAEALIIGMALALSSTAIVIQLLANQKRMASATGRTGFAVLLFQDIAVVPLLVLVSVLSARGSGNADTLAEGLGLAALKAVVAIALILLIGRYLLRPLFRSVAKTGSSEYFMAACLLVVLGTGLVTAASGLSMALGAFVAGLILAETEFRREIEATIEPFKGLLIGVFFFSVGMALDVDTLLSRPLAVVAGVFGLLAIKFALLVPAARAFRVSRPVALEAALLLAPAGEFAFVVVELARSGGLVSHDMGKLALIIASVTMAMTPFLAVLGRRLGRATPAIARQAPAELALTGVETPPPVIIAGFGRVGELVADMLHENGVDYVAVDGDPDLVAKARRRGRKVWFGDAASIETLERCGLAQASVLVATMDSRKGVETIAASARARRPDLVIIARARDPGHVAKLYEIGVTEAVPEAFEASLHMSEAALIGAGVPLGLAIASVHERRDQHRNAFQRMERAERASPAARLRARRHARMPGGKPKGEG